MLKKIVLLCFLSLILLVQPAYSGCSYILFINYEVGLDPEVKMYILDLANHYPREFHAVLRDVYLNHDDYTKYEIGDFVTTAYETIQRRKDNVSIYNIAKDIQRYTEDELGIDLKTYIAAYVRSQIN